MNSCCTSLSILNTPLNKQQTPGQGLVSLIVLPHNFKQMDTHIEPYRERKRAVNQSMAHSSLSHVKAASCDAQYKRCVLYIASKRGKLINTATGTGLASQASEAKTS